MDKNDVNVGRGENLPKKQFIAFLSAAFVISSFAVGVSGNILSVLFFIVIRIVVKVFDLVFKLPILKIPNHVLGLVLGSCFGLFLSLLISYAFGVFEPFFQGSDLVFFRGFSVGKTVLVRLFNEFFLQLFF